jgi:GTP cyclohydrolase I
VKNTLPDTEPVAIADVQNAADSRQIAINRVGIRSIRHPVQVRDMGGEVQATIAVFNMYVNLAKHVKGTHMSRFIEILNEFNEPYTVPLLKQLLSHVCQRLHADEAVIEMSFPYFVRKKAPVTGVESMMDYQVSWVGEVINQKPVVTLKVVVPVTSLCPCSKKIADYGAHNQRSEVTVSVKENGFISIGELIRLIESESSCELFGLLKRPDEKFITERAYDNPKFVEDMVRDVALRLNQDDRVAGYVIESENFESIHNHSAYARIEFEK